VVCVSLPEWRHHRSVDDSINICLAGSGKPRMKIVVGPLNIQDTNVAPEISVYCRLQFFGLELPIQFHCRDLAFGMNACIGPA
jgi:hypothetical protein